MSTWIEWQYCDHGHSGYKQLEVPESYKTDEDIRDYIIETCNIPTWSERYMKGRVQFRRLKQPSKVHVEQKIKILKRQRKNILSHIRDLEKVLETLTWNLKFGFLNEEVGWCSSGSNQHLF